MAVAEPHESAFRLQVPRKLGVVDAEGGGSGRGELGLERVGLRACRDRRAREVGLAAASLDFEQREQVGAPLLGDELG